MRLRSSRIGLRGLMAIVALDAAVLGWRQHQVYGALRYKYELVAIICVPIAPDEPPPRSDNPHEITP